MILIIEYQLLSNRSYMSEALEINKAFYLEVLKHYS